MIDLTYDREADAVYLRIGHGAVDHTDEAGPFIYDVDSDGRILGVEILSASKVLASGDWRQALPPRAGSADAAE